MANSAAVTPTRNEFLKQLSALGKQIARMKANLPKPLSKFPEQLDTFTNYWRDHPEAYAGNASGTTTGRSKKPAQRAMAAGQSRDDG